MRSSWSVWVIGHAAGLLMALGLTIASSGYGLEHPVRDNQLVEALMVARWILGAGTLVVAGASATPARRSAAHRPPWWTILGWPLTIGVVVLLHIVRY